MALEPTKISTTLVGTTLGTSSRDVGTLCTHSAINPWSRWKPISYWSNSGITNDILKEVGNGFIVDSSCIEATLNTDIPSMNWHYTKPTGGAESPFRLGDFRNYDHDAMPFLYSGYPLNYTSYISYGNDAIFNLSICKKTRENGGLQLSDFDMHINSSFNTVNLKDLHFGVYLYSINTPENNAVFIQSLSINDGGWTVNVDNSWIAANTPLKATMILCTNDFAINTGNASTTGKAYALPHGNIIKKWIPNNYETTIQLNVSTTPPTYGLYLSGSSGALNGIYVDKSTHFIPGDTSIFEHSYTTPFAGQSTYLQTGGNYGTVYFKCYFAGSGTMMVNPNLVEVKLNGNFVDSSAVLLKGSEGCVYDKNKVQQYSNFSLQSGEYFYIGLEYALCPGIPHPASGYLRIPIEFKYDTYVGHKGVIYVEDDN